MLQQDSSTQEVNTNSAVGPDRKPLIRKLNFDDSPGLPNKPGSIPLSKLIITKEKRGYSDSHLANPMYRKSYYDSGNDSDDSPGQLFQPGLAYTYSEAHISKANFQNINNSHQAQKVNLFGLMKHGPSLIIEEESTGTKTSLDSECESFQERVIQLSALPANRRASKSQPSGLTGPFPSDIKNIFGESILENLEQELENKETKSEISNLLLPVIKNSRDPDLNTIEMQTLIDLMNNPKGQNYLIIDCRYEYEFEGGHIKGAINLPSPDILEKLFFTHRNLIYNGTVLEEIKKDLKSVLANPRNYHPFDTCTCVSNPPILIFHCEFSQKRGPRAFRTLRSVDRQLNIDRFPNLHYPEIYVLEGGYSQFYSKFPTYCAPEGYVKMLATDCKQDYAEARDREKRSWKKKYSIDIVSGMQGLKISDKDV